MLASGKWVDHPDPNYMGEYNMTTDCPSFVHDYDCKQPNSPNLVPPDLIRSQYRCILDFTNCPHSLCAECCALFRVNHSLLVLCSQHASRCHFVDAAPKGICSAHASSLSAGKYSSRTHASCASQTRRTWRPAWVAGASSCSGTASCACTSTRWRACCAPMLLMATPLLGPCRTSG